MRSDAGPIVNPTWSLATRALEIEPSYVSARRATIDGDTPMSPARAQHPRTLGGNPVYASASTNSSENTLIESQTRTPESDNDAMVLDEDQDEKMNTGLERDPMDPEAMPLLAGSEEPEAPRRLPPVPPSSAEPTQVIDLTGDDLPNGDAGEQKPPVPARPALKIMIGPVNRPGAEADDGPYRMKAEAAAQQQDVAEAMDNVLFKLRCSIENDLEGNGKVYDRIKRWVCSVIHVQC
jgi:hypothetical protein